MNRGLFAIKFDQIFLIIEHDLEKKFPNFLSHAMSIMNDYSIHAKLDLLDVALGRMVHEYNG